MKFIALALVLFAVGCRSAWNRHDESLYTVMKEPSPETTLAHAILLKQILDAAEAAHRRPPAGMCAEYAYYQAKLGRLAEARPYLKREAEHYPEAKKFLEAFSRFLEGVRPTTGNSKRTAK
jgi:hypothetical protein